MASLAGPTIMQIEQQEKNALKKTNSGGEQREGKETGERKQIQGSARPALSWNFNFYISQKMQLGNFMKMQEILI